MNEKEKEEKNVDETLEFINKILDYDKDAQNIFHRASKVDKKKSKPKIEKSISEKSEQKSDQSIPKWMQVSKDRFDFLRIPYTYTAT